MSLTYSTYITSLANLMPVPSTDADFLSVLPNAIDFAEQRIYRDLSLLSTIVRDSSANLTTNSRSFTLPQSAGRFVTVSGANVITPSTATTADGTRNRLNRCSLAFLDFLFPAEVASGTSVPSVFSMVTDQQIVVGAAPDAAYNVEIIGTIRPTPLSVSNTTTVLSVYLPDLFLAASMVFMSGYMKNYGAQADDPKQSMSWEGQYRTLLSNANSEETRKRYNEAYGGSLVLPPSSGNTTS